MDKITCIVINKSFTTISECFLLQQTVNESPTYSRSEQQQQQGEEEREKVSSGTHVAPTTHTRVNHSNRWWRCVLKTEQTFNKEEREELEQRAAQTHLPTFTPLNMEGGHTLFSAFWGL